MADVGRLYSVHPALCVSVFSYTKSNFLHILEHFFINFPKNSWCTLDPHQSTLFVLTLSCVSGLDKHTSHCCLIMAVRS